MQYRKNFASIRAFTDRILSGEELSRDEAAFIMSLHDREDIVMLMAHANALREFFAGHHIHLCAIVNAKSGRCSEDCIFCAQSARHKTGIEIFPLLDRDEIVRQAKTASLSSISCFSIVTSGRSIKGKKELATICDCIQEIAAIRKLVPCASLGILTRKQAQQLKEAGLKRYHHNLETAESFFSSVCSTHSFHERLQTIRFAQEAGIEVCAGGILGMGETPGQRVELAFLLRELDVASVPLNFLNPIPGTPAEKYPLLLPLEILKSIAMFRFVMPGKEIRVCGGRETALRTLQPLMYIAGANGTMVGNYLTTSGRDPAVDVQEILDLGLSPAVTKTKVSQSAAKKEKHA